MAYWQTKVGSTLYTITIIDHFVRLTKSDGSPDTYGGNDVPAQRFLRSEQLKTHVLEIYGEAVFGEVRSEAEKAAGLPISQRKA